MTGSKMALYRLKDSPFWWVDITNPRTNQRIRKSTRLKDKEQATLFEQQLMASLVLGEQHYSLQAKQHKHTWKDATERWLAETKHKKDTRNDLDKVRWLKPYLDHLPLTEITASLIQTIGERKTKEASKPTANRTLSFIRSILRKAYKQWDWLEKVPYIQLYKEDSRRVRYLTKEEASRLLAELPEHLKDMALFSLQTGLRKSNVTGLLWNQVDLQRHHIWIHPDQAKAGQAISVPLNPIAFSIIENQIGKHLASVFTFKGKPIKQLNTKAWQHALKRAGIINFRWHDLRHTWASWHIQSGTPPHILQELGGWSSYEMVRRYAHLSSGHLKEFAKNVTLQE